jgi:pSer/pThr/pTyr-binding forkhead associated (FHA) protein
LSTFVQVSEQHARLWRDGQGNYVVEDMAESTGTWLNGRRLQPRQPARICPGDELEFGRQAVDGLRYRVKMVHESVWDLLGNAQQQELPGNGQVGEGDLEPELAAV